jgi:cold shock CspA family protein
MGDFQKPARRRLFGIVKKWDIERGFGFIESEDGASYFLHVNQLPRPWMDREAQAQLVGQSLTFNLSRDHNGRTYASDVFIVHADDQHLVGEIA